MRRTATSLVYAAASFLSLASVAYANSRAVPCAVGSGDDGGCSFCEEDKAIEVTSWDKPTSVSDFTMANSSAQSGGGYDVWWRLEQPGDGCRILLFDPFNTDKGSIVPGLAGNVVVSVKQRGCYFAKTGSRGIAAGACCGEDCKKAGAVPYKRDIVPRSLPLSRVMRSIRSPKTESEANNIRARSPQWQNGDPYAEEDKPAQSAPLVSCTKPEAHGSTYTKAGYQTLEGMELPCDKGCSMDRSAMVSASTSLSSENSVTTTQSNGVSVNVMVGFMFPVTGGPMGSVTAGYNHDWSKAVTEAMGTTKTSTESATLSHHFDLYGGLTYDIWTTPTLECQGFRMMCNGIEQKVEKCKPLLNHKGEPTGMIGMVVTGN